MRVFVIGGITLSRKHPKYRGRLSMTSKLMEEIGRRLVLHRHELLVCSPHVGSADRDAVRGAAPLLKKVKEARIEFHTPLLEETQKELQLLIRFLPPKKIKTFHYPVSADEHGTPNFTYTWLLSQLSAMARSQVVLTCGGRLDGAASLLLPIAESQRKNILPLTFLGGAAAQSFERQRNELTARLGNDVSALQNKALLDKAVALIDTLPGTQITGTQRTVPIRVFLSYPTTRKNDADNVESLLRSRGCEVYRDKLDFEAGRSIQGEIREYIHRASIFVAIWCQDYACSPWCFDEIDLALVRHKDGRMTPWILCFDDTPIIPPLARGLPYYQVPGRRELETTLLKLLRQAKDKIEDSKGKH